MDTTLIMEDTYNLIEEIKKSKEYLSLKESYNNLISDKDASILIEKFNVDKDNYNKNKNNKDFIKALSLSKKELYSHPLYKTYSDNLIAYNKMISSIEEKINKALYLDDVLDLSKSGCKKWLKE